mgnify:CR=1 FL=1
MTPNQIMSFFCILGLVSIEAALVRADNGEGVWMSDSDLNRQFRGAEIDGHYASGRTFSEAYHTDGRLAYRERNRETRGRWSIEAGSFCTIYDSDASGGCYRVRRIGRNCFEFYFVARTEEQVRQDPDRPRWTARGWVKSEAATCADGASV